MHNSKQTAAELAFTGGRRAAEARLAAIDPSRYAATRNHLDGAVTRLSPYLTHGLLTLREVVAHMREHHEITLEHKLVQELGWRAWWHHAWRHRGEAIFESLHAGPMPEPAYARELPADVRQVRTGVPVVDESVRALYGSGYLHNHARMWLASYLVHVRHVHWRSGADWMHAHLLDGDLASNHLSWQWIAGTGSHQPYLFNADNVARYAPEPWHSFGTVVDASYEALGVRAAVTNNLAHALDFNSAPRTEAPAFSVPLNPYSQICALGGIGLPAPGAAGMTGSMRAHADEIEALQEKARRAGFRW